MACPGLDTNKWLMDVFAAVVYGQIANKTPVWVRYTREDSAIWVLQEVTLSPATNKKYHCRAGSFYLNQHEIELDRNFRLFPAFDARYDTIFRRFVARCKILKPVFLTEKEFSAKVHEWSGVY